jgi:hypothetical protein
MVRTDGWVAYTSLGPGDGLVPISKRQQQGYGTRQSGHIGWPVAAFGFRGGGAGDFDYDVDWDVRRIWH